MIAILLVAASLDLGPKSLSYGVGIRVGGGYSDATAANGLGVGTLDVRPYIGTQIAPWLKFSGNLDLNNGDGGRIHVLDAVAQFEPSDYFNVWMGRFLPPSDRANLSGPYYQNAWNYPTVVNGYPAIYAGRDDGAAIWGQVGGGKLKYQAGVFTVDAAVPFAQAIYAGRVVYDFLDPEPGYYNSSTYYGAKDILAVGVTAQYKKTGDAKMLGMNVDALFEKKIAAGNVITVEGAYYDFDQGNVAGQQGRSFFALGSFMFGDKLGPGRVQPMVRLQEAWTPGIDGATRAIDGGLNYILDGHNARVGLAVQNLSSGTNSVQLGVQIQE